MEEIIVKSDVASVKKVVLCFEKFQQDTVITNLLGKLGKVLLADISQL